MENQKQEVQMHLRSIRKRFILPCAIGAALAANAGSQTARTQTVEDALAKKAYLIEKISMKEPVNPDKASFRAFCVARLSDVESAYQDRELVKFFLDLIRNDPDEWVRLEAAGDIEKLDIPADMVEEVNAVLEQSRKSEAVNFQVMAALSKVKISKRGNKQDLASVKALAKIAQGQDKKAWKIMVPPHNRNSKITDPGTKAEISFEAFLRTQMRLFAMDGLAISNDDFSKQVLKDLGKDADVNVKERAAKIQLAIK